MKTTCPECGYNYDTAAAKNAPLQALNAMYVRFGLCEGLVREYIKLFAPASGRGNSIDKETRLVKELLKVWDDEYFERGRRGWRIDRDHIKDALEGICNRQVALKTHGYLLAVLQAKAAEIEILSELKKHQTAMNRPRTVDQGMSRAATNNAPQPHLKLRGGAEGGGVTEPDDPAETRRIIEEGKRKLGIRNRPPLSPEEAAARKENLLKQAASHREGGD